MRYLALAVDYDGTIAHDGVVDDETIAALERTKKSGRKVILATGRQLDDLKTVFPRIDVFDRIVAENGALLVRPSTKEEILLAPPPPPAFVRALRGAGVDPLAVGKVIVATWTPHETTVLRTIRDLGLDLQIIFNKGAVMILPPSVNKAFGVRAALDDLGLSTHNLVGVGDAENDHALLAISECGVAVQNALPSLKARADIVTADDHGAGVREIVAGLLENDLRDAEPKLARHRISLGPDIDASAFDENLLVVGSSGGGKSTFATMFLERLAERGWQFCVVDPEGDYTTLDAATALGDARRAPAVNEVLDFLEAPAHEADVNLLAIPLEERPQFFASLMPRIAELRQKTGRPHFVVVDEAHHVLPRATRPDASLSVDGGVVLITVHPDQVSAPALANVRRVLVIGADPGGSLAHAAAGLGVPAPSSTLSELAQGDAYLWDRARGDVVRVHIDPPRGERLRHRRKYAEGDLGPNSFVFRGPDDRLNLRAENLVTFVKIAGGVDDATWLFHLKRGDYARWFTTAIKDEDLAHAVDAVAHDDVDANVSREHVARAIHERYTLP